ncbi:hypothetical protein [Microbulbifer sp. ALW1]|uniref:hypothetical protein n=1 Tax=Microbulbifer sp. (strain ALW1) TaxID=1516059 RepID=UPI00135B7726|nr:hypothetical protein [Microbulbifer sp. ALW1]
MTAKKKISKIDLGIGVAAIAYATYGVNAGEIVLPFKFGSPGSGYQSLSENAREFWLLIVSIILIGLWSGFCSFKEYYPSSIQDFIGVVVDGKWSMDRLLHIAVLFIWGLILSLYLSSVLVGA